MYTKDIVAITIECELVQLYTFSGERHPLLKNLEYIESVCNSHQFYHINRQMLINRNAIQSIEPYFKRH
nr:LytTR family transcriptional regulator DNA-binding domain-containing protein [Siphonobacter sp. SORGH_AS_0500]